MAGTCPKCGVKIADNLVKCPQCGRLSLKGKTECPLCKTPLPQPQAQPQAGNQTQEARQAQAPQPAPQPLPQPRRKKRGCLGWGCLIALLMMAGLGMGGFFYWTYLSHQAREESEYKRLEGVTNPQFYQQFLDDFPDSEHAGEVKAKMDHLKKEASEWETASKERNRIVLTRFLQNYPGSIHERECQDMIDSIDWKEAASLNTEQAVQNYLDHHPNGQFTDDAAERMIMYSQKKISDRDKSHIRGILDAFFSNGLARGDLEAIGNAIPGSMTDFNGTKPATAEQIARFTAERKAADVMGIHYLINPDMQVTNDTLPDGSMAYAVTFTMDETINRSDANQPSTKIYKVSAHLNGDKKIVDMKISQ